MKHIENNYKKFCYGWPEEEARRRLIENIYDISKALDISTEELKDIFEPIQDDKEATLAAGIQFAVRQCRELLDSGAPGLHFYCLNKAEPTATILSELRK